MTYASRGGLFISRCMKSFQTVFCEERGCATADFTRKVFWRCLPRRARLCAACLGGSGARFFLPERVLLARVGATTSLRQLEEELDEFLHHPDNRGFLRMTLRIRISTTRLRRLAQGCLPKVPAGSTQPPRDPPGGSGTPFNGKDQAGGDGARSYSPSRLPGTR